MLVGVEQVCVCSPALLLSSETQQGQFWALDIWTSSPMVILGNVNWNIQEEARAIISWGLFTFQRWGWFPCKKPCQGLVWGGRSLEKTLGHSAGDRNNSRGMLELFSAVFKTSYKGHGPTCQDSLFQHLSVLNIGNLFLEIWPLALTLQSCQLGGGLCWPFKSKQHSRTVHKIHYWEALKSKTCERNRGGIAANSDSVTS